MKAITAVCATGASVPAIVNGRISRHRDGENAEIQMYLSKLKDLVPYMPKNRKLSKLEIIQHVIDYICDLQSELETHPAVNNFDAAAALNGQQQQSYYQETHHHHHQQQHQYQQQQQNYHQAEMNNAISAADPSRVNYGGNSNSIASSSLLSSSPLSVMTSSPPVRQPLSDRPAPNTILSPSHNNPLSSPTVILAGHQSNHLTINTQNHLHTISDKDTNDRSKSC